MCTYLSHRTLGGARNFLMNFLMTLPKKGLKCNWLVTVTAKNLREKRSAPSDEDPSPFCPLLVLHRWIRDILCFIVGGGVISRWWIFF